MDEQEIRASSWSLLREFVKKYRDKEEELKAALGPENPGFDELLDGVKDCVDAIESLHRTRELTWKASDNEGTRTVRIILQPYEKREKDKENDKESAGRRSWWPVT
ncbi:hypothetical protein M407DRAFT_247229 [Tulasnella calospora MUT 4182]|uniref:Uncharacterized protein n=1 Tax=Tulasnella calospora MUT 4182 TaxID=1051891 RepID=A0A0C3K210_9AGAM|nr:hypothetical protein M407DRAFT_247229 [Tulasnella calospora MUT 4182]